MVLYPYTEGNQFRTYIAQFMRVFSGFQYKKNTRGDLGNVKVVYGGMDRIIAQLITNNSDHLTNARLPIFAVNMTGIDIDPLGKRSPRHIDSIRNRASDKEDGKSVATRLIGPAFTMNMEVSLYASSTTELLQILEQILLVFNPRVTINVGSYAETGDYLTEIELTSIADEINKPLGTEKQVVSYTLGFEVPVRLKYPSGFSTIVIEKITQTTVANEDEIETEIEKI